jgi:Tfp pilus assembly ATPase PilU
VRELIADVNRTREIHEAIATGRDPYGMISFDQSLTELVNNRFVTYEDAVAASTNPDDFALFFRGVSKGGQVGQDFNATTSQPGSGTVPPGGYNADRFGKE